MSDYLQHGRRHARHGSDPIIGGEVSTWALYGANGGSTVLDGGLTYIGIDWWTWGPADQDLYSLGSGTGALAGLSAPKVDKDGVYKVSVLAGITGTVADEFAVALPGFFANWAQLNTQAEDWGKIKLGNLDPTHAAKFVSFQQAVLIGGLFSSAIAAPWVPVFRVQQVSGVGAFTVDFLEILVEWMSSDYDSTAAAGGVP